MRALVDRFGSPLYVYRLADVREAVAQLRRQLPMQARLYYSLKANPHPLIVAELVRNGLHSEVSSTAELSSALTAGQAPHRCLMTGPGKSEAELDDAVRRGVRTFSVESPVDFERLARVAARHEERLDVLLRLNGSHAAGRGSGLRMSGATTQFGMTPETAVGISRSVDRHGPLDIAGVHIYPATNMPDPDELRAEFELSITTAADVLQRAGLSGRLVDIGGGFATPFAQPGARSQYPRLRVALEAALDRSLPGWRTGEPQIAFESGRYLVGGCGSLLTRVVDIKTQGSQTYVVLDAGINALGGMSGLGRLLVPKAQPVTGPATNGGAGDGEQLNLVGPLCTPLDVLSRSATIPVPSVGQVLEIPNVGAYGFSASLLAFLSRPVPAEVVLGPDDRVVGARRIALVPQEL